MNSITFTDLNRKIILAGNFNEMTKKQLIKVSGIIHRTYHPIEKKVLALKVLMSIGLNPFRNFLFYFRLKPWHVAEMFPAVEFVLKDPDLTKQLIPSIRIPYSFKKLYGPSDYMTNLVFIEFIKAERNYNKFRKTGKLEFLDKLVAILYRPIKRDYNPNDVKHDGDIREKYNDYLVDARAKKISKLDLNTKLAILTYYHGCRDYIIKHSSFPHVFTTEKQAKVDKSQGKYTWETVLIDLSKDNTAYIENTSYTKLYTILLLINNQIEKNIEAAKRIRKSNP